MTSAEELLELRRTERYVVHDAIAMGGMASVHIGVLEGAVGFSRVVAIKRLHQPLAQDERFVAMLLDEARLVSRIRHVNVVPTLDILEADGEVFVIMEYVRGASLARLLDLTYARDELVPLRLATPILVGVLRGLDAAHEATDLEGTPLGIVHRDVSPQNILVGVGGVPRLIDFGVARALGKSETTKSGEFKGKISYAAPEQLGEGTVTPQSDVYAVGIVLWEVLTGTRLFKADTDIATFRKAAKGQIASPSELYASSPRMQASRSAEEVEIIGAIAMRALERDPKKRFATAAEMAVALEHALRGAPSWEIGAWVQRLARAELSAEQSIVMKAEEDIARRAKKRPPHLSLSDHGIEPARGLAGMPDSRPRLQIEPGAERRRPPAHAVGPRELSLGMPAFTLVAIALAAAAGAGIGAAYFASRPSPAAPPPASAPVIAGDR